MKMETPKMDVVRFQEADVIVASPVSPIYLSGFNNNDRADGYLSINDGANIFRTADYATRDDFVNAIIGAGVADVSFNDAADPDTHSIGGMYHADNEDGVERRSLILPDGYYKWNGRTYSNQ